MKKKKELRDLNLMDRFLFSEAMEDREFAEDVLSIILGEEIYLKNPPQDVYKRQGLCRSQQAGDQFPACRSSVMLMADRASPASSIYSGFDAISPRDSIPTSLEASTTGSLLIRCADCLLYTS